MPAPASSNRKLNEKKLQTLTFISVRVIDRVHEVFKKVLCPKRILKTSSVVIAAGPFMHSSCKLTKKHIQSNNIYVAGAPRRL